MSLSSNATVAEIFERLAPVKKARSRWDREAEFIERHKTVAQHYADAVFLRLTSAPDVVERTVTAQVLGERFEAALDDLISEAAKVCERSVFPEEMTRLQGEARLIQVYRRRIDALAFGFQRGSA